MILNGLNREEFNRWSDKIEEMPVEDIKGMFGIFKQERASKIKKV